MKLLNYLFFNMLGSVLECCELTGVRLKKGFKSTLIVIFGGEVCLSPKFVAIIMFLYMH